MNPLLYTWWWPRTPADVPIVLMLHSVGEEAVCPVSPNNTVRPAELESLICRLQGNGYSLLSISEAARGLKRRSVVLTFDDGCRDNFETLLPIVQRRNCRITCFVTNRGEKDPAFLSPSQMREMDASGLVEFGGHTSRHTTLTQASPDEVRSEIRGNKAWIEDVLGGEIHAFSYPCGQYSPSIVDEVKDAGYSLAVTMEKRMRPFSADPFRIHRQIMPRGLDGHAAYLLATRGRYKL